MAKERCTTCGRASGVTITDGVCSICNPPQVAQKHVDGVSVTKIRKYAADEEAAQFVAKKPSPALKKPAAKPVAKEDFLTKLGVKKPAAKKAAPAKEQVKKAVPKKK